MMRKWCTLSTLKLVAMMIAMTTLLVVPVQASTIDENTACHEMMDDCDHGSEGTDQTCPDDMNCQSACASLSANAALLIPATLPVLRPDRISLVLAQSTRVREHLSTLNAPPPRA